MNTFEFYEENCEKDSKGVYISQKYIGYTVHVIEQVNHALQ